ncbi:MAG: hypothetical protein ABMB14_20405 [Myxococcota bacterium]
MTARGHRRVRVAVRVVVGVVAVLGATGCVEPDPTQLFNHVGLSVTDDEAVAAAPFVEAIDDADDTVYAALPAGEDPAVPDALLGAYSRGVDVQVLTDWDLATSPGIARLLDAGVPVALRDAGLTYFEFNVGEDVGFTSDMTRMAHAYVVADQTRVVAASTIGRSGPGTRIVFDARGEDLVQDLMAEHVQVYGGTDSTAVDAYDAPAKSILETRWRYGTTTDTDLELWFGPQERLTKRVIDAVYSARSAVWILTDDLENEGLARALEDKAKWGFDVQVIVGPRFGTASAAISRIFEQETPDVSKRRLVDGDVIPTIVLVDLPDDPEGYRPHARAMVMNHDLYSASRLYRGEPVLTDQLIDSAMWVFASDGPPGAELVTLQQVYEDHLARTVEF